MKSWPLHPSKDNQLVILAVVATACFGVASGAQPNRAPDPKPEAKALPAPAPFYVYCVDGSTLKLVVREEKLEVRTRYGKLNVPLEDIQRIELATRLPDETARRIEAAIAHLGSAEFRQREAATADLMALEEKGYPALRKAARQSDPEVVRRAQELLERIHAAVPAERLEVRAQDVIYTNDWKITGQLFPAVWTVRTGQFGEQQLKLADVRDMSREALSPPAETALPDPGTLQEYQSMVGRTLSFHVTGGAVGGMRIFRGALPGQFGGLAVQPQMNGAIWGTDIYTLDSALALAAVHAGLVRHGQTGIVRVTILGPQPAFFGSTRNGVASNNFGPFPGAYRFVRRKE